MKLYYSAGSCSTSCHISLEESGLKYQAIGVDWDNSADANIAVVTKLNPLGTLPIMITDEGKQLDQNLSIHTYIADKAPGKKLLPPAGTIERAEAMNWLSFVASDLHKSFSPLFSVDAVSPDKSARESIRKYYVEKTNGYLNYMNGKLADKNYLMGQDFCVADSYAFVVTGWTKWVDISLSPYKNVQAYLTRIANRPAVAKVLQEEGLTES